nr:hypothetical protein [Tanacetum cinerariifolium]
HQVHKLLTRVLRIILEIMPEHLSDTYVFTIKMEILLEPTVNKLLVGGGGGIVVVVMTAEVIADYVGSGEPNCDVVRSITEVVIGGIEEVS